MTNFFIFILLLFPMLGFTQVDLNIYVKDSTWKKKKEVHTQITFDIYIKNQYPEAIFFPYNASTENDESDESVFIGLKVYPRFYNLIQENDTFSLFSRTPIVTSSSLKGRIFERWSKYIHLNFYGHPKDGEPDFVPWKVYMELIKYIKIKSGTTYHIRSVFQFKTEKKPFSDYLKDNGLYMKVVLFKKEIDGFQILMDSSKIISDTSSQDSIIHKAFYISKWKKNTCMKSVQVPIDSGKMKTFQWQEPMTLDILYFFGGW